MPLYTYECKECGHVEEGVLILSVSTEAADKPQVCVSCQTAGSFRKVFSGGKYLISYKGSGFYQTDYNNKSTQ